MDSISREITELRSRIGMLTDRLEIRELMDRYVVSLDTVDECRYDDAWYGSIFLPDARFAFPIGDHRGVAGLAAFQLEAKARWLRTHHVSANYVIELDGDRATLRAHQLASHVHPGSTPLGRFEVGGRYHADAVRTPAGWRIGRLAFHVEWTAGPPLPSYPRS